MDTHGHTEAVNSSFVAIQREKYRVLGNFSTLVFRCLFVFIIFLAVFFMSGTDQSRFSFVLFIKMKLFFVVCWSVKFFLLTNWSESRKCLLYFFMNYWYGVLLLLYNHHHYISIPAMLKLATKSSRRHKVIVKATFYNLLF